MTITTVLIAWFVGSLPFSIIAGKCLKRLDERNEAVRRLVIE